MNSVSKTWSWNPLHSNSEILGLWTLVLYQVNGSVFLCPLGRFIPTRPLKITLLSKVISSLEVLQFPDSLVQWCFECQLNRTSGRSMVWHFKHNSSDGCRQNEIERPRQWRPRNQIGQWWLRNQKTKNKNKNQLRIGGTQFLPSTPKT